VIVRTVERVAPLARALVLASSSVARGREIARLLPLPVGRVPDRTARWGHGPGAGIASALASGRVGPVLFVPGDMPWLEVEALRRFVTAAERSTADVAAPWWGSGETENLLQWHRRRDLGSRLPLGRFPEPGPRRASEFLRAAPRTLFVPAELLTRSPRSFAHVTHRSDLEAPPPRGSLGHRRRSRLVRGAPKRAYWKAQALRARGDREGAARAFRAEARWYDREGLFRLARHASDDARRLGGNAPRGSGADRGVPPGPRRRAPRKR
jgi:molybdopterin-guanine dinucleotide biosynthesis protein A